DQGELWQSAGRLRLRQPAKTRTAERPPVFGAHHGTYDAEGSHLMRFVRQSSGLILTFVSHLGSTFANVRDQWTTGKYYCWWSFGFDGRMKDSWQAAGERQIRSTAPAADRRSF